MPPDFIQILIQIRNPSVDRYVKIDRSTGRIMSHKKTAGPYKGVRIAASWAFKWEAGFPFG
ncbi:MAG: hypothetical protein IIC26_06085 [Chloroflexi bacterium]|nr:hypothetical protein [Chloroflexota bacterium]